MIDKLGTIKNLDKIYACIKEHLENENGGEFDSDSDMLGAVRTVIEWLEEKRVRPSFIDFPK